MAEGGNFQPEGKFCPRRQYLAQKNVSGIKLDHQILCLFVFKKEGV